VLSQNLQTDVHLPQLRNLWLRVKKNEVWFTVYDKMGVQVMGQLKSEVKQVEVDQENVREVVEWNCAGCWKSNLDKSNNPKPVNRQSISESGFLVCNAQQSLGVSFHLLSDMDKDEWCFTAGSKSKATQTWTADPDRPGCSNIMVSPSKVCVALGNLIRVYVYDIL